MKLPYINAILRMFKREPKTTKHGWERYSDKDVVDLPSLEDPKGPPTLQGSLFCCHGSGHAQFEKIVTCQYPAVRSEIERKALAALKKNSPIPCGASWHSGCVTKYVLSPRRLGSLVLMDNTGAVHRTPRSNPFACCEVWLKDAATVRDERNRYDIEGASSRRHRQRIAKLNCE